MRGTTRLLGVAALVITTGSGIARAENEPPALPLRGPIPFELFDLDGSGAISEQEFDQMRGRRVEAREKAGLPSMRGIRSFGSLDGDGDGEITLEEFRAAHVAGAAGPGRESGKRSGRGRGMGGSPLSFSEFDLDGDGAIVEQEFIDARTRRIAARVREGRMMRGLPTAPSFSDLDTDGDGSLTPDEFSAGVQRHRERMGTEAPAASDP